MYFRIHCILHDDGGDNDVVVEVHNDDDDDDEVVHNKVVVVHILVVRSTFLFIYFKLNSDIYSFILFIFFINK